MVILMNKEKVFKLLQSFPCSTAKQLAYFYYREYKEIIKPASISAYMRQLVLTGKAADSVDIKGSKVYWIKEE